MAGRSDHDFRVGRSRSRGNRTDTRLPFVKQVEAAIRKAGGNPTRIGLAGKGSGRVNARGRGAKLSFPKDSGGGGGVGPRKRAGPPPGYVWGERGRARFTAGGGGTSLSSPKDGGGGRPAPASRVR